MSTEASGHRDQPAGGSTEPAAARAEAVSKTYRTGPAAVRALDAVTLRIPRGQLTAVMGPSGSGKSTLLHCLAGLDTVDAGRVLIGDEDLTRLDDRRLTRLRRDRIGFVFQSFNLVPTLTALENITLPVRLAGRRPDRDWIEAIVATTGLRDRLHHRPSQLSGGQQQRVACARALASRPEIVFADEPTGNLDSRSGAEVLRLLKESVRHSGQTVVMVTHDPVAAGYADRVLFLSDGRLVGELAAPTAATVLERLVALESAAGAEQAPEPGR